MVSLPVYDKTGAEVGQYEIDPAAIAPRINKQLLHDAIVMYRCNQRLGTVKTKGRSEVAGTTKKMYRQKGTGNARAGSRRSGIRVGGGHIHALRPRDWSYRLPRKALQLATRMALASKLSDGQVVLINELKFAAPKTREMAGIVKALKLQDMSVLVAVDGYDANAHRSIRNMANVTLSPVAELNALTVLRPRRLLMTTAAMDSFKQKSSGKQAS